MDSFKELQSTLGLAEHEMISIFGSDYLTRDMTIVERRFVDTIFSDTSKIRVNLFFTVFKQITDVKAREYLLGQLLMQNSLSDKDLFYINQYLMFASSKSSDYFFSINSLLKKSEDDFYSFAVNSFSKKLQLYTMRYVIGDYISSSPNLVRAGSKLSGRCRTTTLCYRLLTFLNLDLKELNLLVGQYMALCLYSDDYITDNLYNLLKGLFNLTDDSFVMNKLEFGHYGDLQVDMLDLRRVFRTIVNIDVRWQVICTLRYDYEKVLSLHVFMDVLLKICDGIDSGLLSSYSVSSVDKYCKLLSLNEIGDR